MDFKINYTSKEITAWGGLEFMKRLIEKTGIINFIDKMEELPQQGSNRGYRPVQIIQSFWLSIWSGGNRYTHLEVIRYDRVLQKLFGWKQMPGYKAYQRYFLKYTYAINHKVFHRLYQWFFTQLQFDNYTLDFDSTIFTRYGEQQGARKGYNPKKPGRKSHHPLMAFVSDCRMVANFWLRSGDSSASNNFESFLLDTLAKLRGKIVGLMRLDSGFYSDTIMSLLERMKYNYILSARLYYPLQVLIARHKLWLKLDNGVEIAELEYQAGEWQAPRRIIVVRQEKELRPRSAGKQLSLFEEDEIIGQYRYSAYVTNLDLPAREVWNIYRGRADSENRIKELKEDFGMANFSCNSFDALEATLNWTMMAYNLMSLFRQIVLQARPQSQLKTLRYKLFATAAYITKNGNQRILNLAVAMKNRKWWDGLFGRYQEIVFPLNLSG